MQLAEYLVPRKPLQPGLTKIAETGVDGGYDSGNSGGRCDRDSDDDGNGKDGGELVCDDHQWTRRGFLRHRPLICNAYRAGLNIITIIITIIIIIIAICIFIIAQRAA